MIERMPFCPPDDPFGTQAQLAGRQIQVVVDHQHVGRLHLVVARQRGHGLAAGVHIGERADQEHLLRVGRPGVTQPLPVIARMLQLIQRQAVTPGEAVPRI